MGSVGNIVRSMLVVLGLVLLVILIVPRQTAVVQPPVDVTSLAQQVAGQTRWPIDQAQGLPAGWRATSVRYDRGADGLMTWHVGYLTADQNYVALEQTKAATGSWVSTETNQGVAQGTVQAAGRTWSRFARTDKGQYSLVDRGTGSADLTTVVTGTASYAVLATFATYLQPVKS